MKSWFYVISFLIIFSCSSPQSTTEHETTTNSTTIEEPKKDIQRIHRFAPFLSPNHYLIDSAFGDLNKDDVEDVALISEIKTGEEYLRELIILIKDTTNDTYTLSARSTTAIPFTYFGGDDTGDNRYFGKLSIANNTVVFDDELSPAGKIKYVYRYQKGGWYLIGYSAMYPKQGYSFGIDYNLNTGRFIGDYNSLSEDTTGFKIDTIIKPKELPKLEEYSPGSIEMMIGDKNVYL